MVNDLSLLIERRDWHLNAFEIADVDPANSGPNHLGANVFEEHGGTNRVEQPFVVNAWPRSDSRRILCEVRVGKRRRHHLGSADATADREDDVARNQSRPRVARFNLECRSRKPLRCQPAGLAVSAFDDVHPFINVGPRQHDAVHDRPIGISQLVQPFDSPVLRHVAEPRNARRFQGCRKIEPPRHNPVNDGLLLLVQQRDQFLLCTNVASDAPVGVVKEAEDRSLFSDRRQERMDAIEILIGEVLQTHRHPI